MKFDGILICTDCDGTLTDNQQRIPPENRKAIAYFQQNGGLFTVATGRSPNYLSSLPAKGLTVNAPIIAVNGALIYDPIYCRPLYDLPLDGGAIEAFAFACQESGILERAQIVNIEGAHIWQPGGQQTVEELASTVAKPWYKFLFVTHTEQEMAHLRASLEGRYGRRYRFDRSWPVGLEMHSLQSGKGECLERLRGLIGRPIHTTIGVGDYENDISLLQMADIGIAVANAIEPVKRAADRVTVSNEEAAIAKVIYGLGKL